MTHAEASRVVADLRSKEGTWVWNGHSFDWIPSPECDFEAVQVASYRVWCVQLKRKSGKI